MSKPRVEDLCEDSATRDAIHVPIIPVRCGDPILYPGTRIVLYQIEDEFYARRAEDNEKNIGYVSIYLTNPVYPNERFYCMLRPESVKKLWHEWTHPAIDGKV